MRLAGLDLGTSAARVALPHSEAIRVVSLSVPGPDGGVARPDDDVLLGDELALLEGTQPISALVLAHHAAASPAARWAMRRTARRHGFDRVRLVSAPVCAAVASILQNGLAGRILVADLGCTGLALAVIEARAPIVNTLALAQTSEVGGDLLDATVAALLVELAGPDPPPELIEFARRDARRARHELTDHFEVRVTLDPVAAPRRMVKASRDQLEQRARKLFMRTEPVVREMLAEVGLRPQDLDHVLLVGGGAYMPLFRRFMAEATGLRVTVPEVPETWAAEGAALYAQSLWGGGRPLRLTLPLGEDVLMSVAHSPPELVLPRGCPLPAQTFVSLPAGQPMGLRPSREWIRPESDTAPEAAADRNGAEDGVEFGGGDAPVLWRVRVDADGVLQSQPAGSPVLEDASADATDTRASARRLPALRAELRALERLFEPLVARGLDPPVSLRPAREAAAQGSCAALAEALLALKAALTAQVDPRA